MAKPTTEKPPVAPALKTLAVGDTATFELSRVNVVKNICSTTALQLGTRYSTHVNRPKGIIEVTRLA